MPDKQSLRADLAAVLAEHDLNLEEVTWKENLVKRTIALGLKVTGVLDVQEDLPFDDGRV